MEPYIRNWVRDSNGQAVENKARIHETGALKISILERGLQIVRSRTITETTQINQIASEEDQEKERKRQFSRTDRGNVILTMSPEALTSNIRHHIKAVRNPTVKRKEMRVSQIWLMYELAWRWPDIPSDLRREAEECRDLPFLSRKR